MTHELVGKPGQNLYVFAEEGDFGDTHSITALAVAESPGASVPGQRADSLLPGVKALPGCSHGLMNSCLVRIENRVSAADRLLEECCVPVKHFSHHMWGL